MYRLFNYQLKYGYSVVNCILVGHVMLYLCMQIECFKMPCTLIYRLITVISCWNSSFIEWQRAYCTFILFTHMNERCQQSNYEQTFSTATMTCQDMLKWLVHLVLESEGFIAQDVSTIVEVKGKASKILWYTAGRYSSAIAGSRSGTWHFSWALLWYDQPIVYVDHRPVVVVFRCGFGFLCMIIDFCVC